MGKPSTLPYSFRRLQESPIFKDPFFFKERLFRNCPHHNHKDTHWFSACLIYRKAGNYLHHLNCWSLTHMLPYLEAQPNLVWRHRLVVQQFCFPAECLLHQLPTAPAGSAEPNHRWWWQQVSGGCKQQTSAPGVQLRGHQTHEAHLGVYAGITKLKWKVFFITHAHVFCHS